MFGIVQTAHEWLFCWAIYFSIEGTAACLWKPQGDDYFCQCLHPSSMCIHTSLTRLFCIQRKATKRIIGRKYFYFFGMNWMNTFNGRLGRRTVLFKQKAGKLIIEIPRLFYEDPNSISLKLNYCICALFYTIYL